MKISPSDVSEVMQLAQTLGADYINLEENTEVEQEFRKSCGAFYVQAMKHFWKRFDIQRVVNRIYELSGTSNEAISSMYDAEYGTSSSHYMYLNALLSKKGFESIIGSSEEFKSSAILDVGAGSNEFLRFCNSSLNIPPDCLYGIDISPASKDIVERDGFHGYVGRAETLPLPTSFFELVYLSYFIDYDTDQRATLTAAVNFAKNNGMIIFEGLLPCRPFGLLKKDEGSFSFITKGRTAAEDLSLLYDAFKEIARNQDKNIIVEKIATGYRYVYSHYGLNKLPSYFLILRIK